MKTASILALTLFLAAGFGLSACSRSDSVEAAREPGTPDRVNTFNDTDKIFIDYAAGMHAGEIRLAELAKQKSTREDIKAYADDVIETHKDALEKLSDTTGDNRSLETTKPSDDTQHHADYLSALSGSEFDGEFIALMIADHKDAASTFRNPFVTVENNKLKDYMQDMAPGLEEEQHDAEKLKQ
jgi:putative membrane protein